MLWTSKGFTYFYITVYNQEFLISLYCYTGYNSTDLRVMFSNVTLFFCRMVNFCSKYLGLLAHQVVGEERLSFFSALLGNSWQHLIPGVDIDSNLPVNITQLVILDLDSAWYL